MYLKEVLSYFTHFAASSNLAYINLLYWRLYNMSLIYIEEVPLREKTKICLSRIFEYFVTTWTKEVVGIFLDFIDNGQISKTPMFVDNKL